MVKKLFFVFIIFIFSGLCSADLPSWYFAVNKDSSSYYGVGSGYNKQEAVAKALGDIASQISSKVNSSISSEVRSMSINNKEDTSKDYSNSVNTKSKNIEITNYKVTNMASQDGQIYLKLKVNKQDLIKLYKNKFDVANRAVDDDYASMNSIPSYLTYSNLKSNISGALKALMNLSIVDLNFNINSYIGKYKNYLKKADQILDGLSVSVSDGGLKQIYSASLNSALKKVGFKIVKSKGYYVFKVIKNMNDSTYQGIYIAKLTLTLEIYSKNKIIISKVFNSKGIGNNSTAAQDKAWHNVFKMVEKTNLKLFFVN